MSGAMDRSQLSEEAYLASFGALPGGQPVLHARSAAALAPADGCLSCARLVRARGAAAAQLLSLTKSEELLEAEVLDLRAELSSTRDALARALAGGPGSGAGAGAGAVAGADADAGVLATLSAGLPDAIFEGDGAAPRTCIAECEPHAGGVLCVASLPTPVAMSLAAGALSSPSQASSLVVASGGADGFIAFSSPPRVLTARVALRAPVLCVAARPRRFNTCYGGGAPPPTDIGAADADADLVAATTIDGRLALISFDGAAARVEFETQAHSGVAPRAAWCKDGGVLASCGADGSLVLWTVGRGVVLERAQGVWFASGGATALTWVCEVAEGEESEGNCTVDALAVAVRGATVLYYVRILRGSGARDLAARIAHSTRGECCAAADDTAALIHRAPLSEDAPRGDVSWPALLRASQGGADADADADAEGAPPPADASLTGPLTRGDAAFPTPGPPARFVSGGADATRVGFFIAELSAAGSCGGDTVPLFALVDDAGSIRIARWGASGRGATLRRIGAGGAARAGGPTTRIAWLSQAREEGGGEGGDPYYLAATGGDENAIRIITLAAGRDAHALAGHNAAVKDIAFSREGQLISASFDKTLRLWGRRERLGENEGVGGATPRGLYGGDADGRGAGGCDEMFHPVQMHTGLPHP